MERTLARDREARTIADGFDLLRNQYQALAEKYHSLQQKGERHTVLQADSADPAVPTDLSDQRLPSHLTAEAVSRDFDDWLDELKGNDPDSKEAVEVIKEAGLAYSRLQSQLHRARIIQSIRPGDMEQDFTTPGKAGRLGCPFGSTKRRKSGLNSGSAHQYDLPTPQESASSQITPVDVDPKSQLSFNDPIAVEKCSYLPKSAEPSASGIGVACPIRFLDQHSPEEVAKYLEAHKHEIPRSHEVCVKRFQANSHSIKQLDAKYGNLENMIKGLGKTHQPMFPDKLGEDGLNREEEARSVKMVAKWAEGVNEGDLIVGQVSKDIDRDSGLPLSASNLGDGEDVRLPHFDRPLKEIRVGESPSRPWGISIPPQYLENLDGGRSVPESPVQRVSSKKQEAVVPIQEKPASQPPNGCPFHKSTENAQDATARDQANPINPLPGAVAEQATTNRLDQPVANGKTEDRVEQGSIGPSTTIINHGVAVLYSQQILGRSMQFVNHGVLFMDSPAAAMEYLRRREALASGTGG